MDFYALLAELARVLTEAAPQSAKDAVCARAAERGVDLERLGPEVPDAARAIAQNLLRAAELRASECDETLRARERAQMLSEASFEGIMIHVDGPIIDANQRLSELTGYDFAEIVKPDFMQRCIVPEELPGVLQRLRDRTEGDYVVTGVRKDGTRWRAEILSKQGKLGERPVRVAAVRDVTERERMMTLLRESEARLRELAETTFDVLAYSRDGIIIDLVGDVEHFFGAPREALIGIRILDIVTSEFQEPVQAHIQKRLSGGLRSAIINKRGEIMPVDIVAISTTLDGIPVRLAGLRDLREAERVETERRRLEQHLQKSQRLESLGVLAGGIAHDFNNLLVGIIGSAQLLALSDLTLEDRESVRAIAEAGERAATLTTQLLAYAGQRDLGQRVPVDLSDMLTELRRLLGPTFAKKAELVLAIEPDCNVLGNRATLLQVLMNLLTNASDAVGGEPGTIFVTARHVDRADERFRDALGAALGERSGPFVLIEVRDTGTGMDEVTRTRIFEPFFSTKKKGHGLGLAACLGIVTAHEGAISVESSLGHGSTFSVLLPAVEAAKVTSPAPERSPSAGRILLVDDEEIVRRQVQRILEVHGYLVVAEEDGRAALARLEHEKFDLVLLDVTLPGLDGTEVVREARRRGQRVPIVLFSGYADFPLETRLEPETYSAFLAKPFSIEALTSTIKRALSS
jgi:PAS domain S-box-containing protein